MPPDEFVLFLDENLHSCQPLLDALQQAGIPFQRHSDHFSAGTPDDDWLPLVGRSGWLLVTHDKRIRYNELERRAILRHGVRAFILTSGNLSGQEMASLLVNAFPQMQRICRRNDPPFITSIAKSGAVHLRYNRFGAVQTRKKRNGD